MDPAQVSVTLVALVLLALAFDFLNGFHDAANSIATVVSTGVLKPWQAVIWAAFFNVLAWAFFHLSVAATVGKGIVDPNFVDSRVIFGALIGALSLGGCAVSRRVTLGRDAFVDEQHRDAVAERVHELAVVAHEPGFEFDLHRFATDVLGLLAAHARVDSLQHVGAGFRQTLTRVGAGQHLEQVAVDRSAVLRGGSHGAQCRAPSRGAQASRRMRVDRGGRGRLDLRCG
jgi:hypothetical protein